MTEMALNFNLPAELYLNVLSDELSLVQDLESYYELGTLLSCQVDVTKLTFAEGFPDFEVVDGPLARIKLTHLGRRPICFVSDFL